MKTTKYSLRSLFLLLLCLAMMLSVTACASKKADDKTEEPEQVDVPEAEEPKADETEPEEEPTVQADPKTLEGDFSEIGGVKFSVKYDGNNYTETSDADRITLTDADGNYIEFRFLNGKTPSDLEMTFADDYLEYSEVTFYDNENIAGSEEYGEMLDIEADGKDFNAWLIETANGTFTITVLRDAQSSAEDFAGILATLKIVYF